MQFLDYLSQFDPLLTVVYGVVSFALGGGIMYGAGWFRRKELIIERNAEAERASGLDDVIEDLAKQVVVWDQCAQTASRDLAIVSEERDEWKKSSDILGERVIKAEKLAEARGSALATSQDSYKTLELEAHTAQRRVAELSEELAKQIQTESIGNLAKGVSFKSKKRPAKRKTSK